MILNQWRSIRAMIVACSPKIDLASSGDGSDGESLRLSDLLSAVATKDQAAFRFLYNETSGRLLRIALALMSQKERAEEALQEAFLLVWLKAHRFDAERGRALAWMGAIVRNVCLDRLRTDRCRQASLVSLTNKLVDDLDSPFQVGIRIAIAIDVRNGLALLDPPCRAAVQSAFVDGLTHAEIAAASGTPIGTIKSRVRRGLIRLKGYIGERAMIV